MDAAAPPPVSPLPDPPPDPPQPAAPPAGGVWPDPGFVPIGVNWDGGREEEDFFVERLRATARALWPGVEPLLKGGLLRKIGTLFSGALDGFGRVAEMLGACELVMQCDNDEAV